MEIQFEDDIISLELLDLPDEWTVTHLTPPVVRLCYQLRFAACSYKNTSVLEPLFLTTDYKATSRWILSREGNSELPAPGGV